MIGLSEYEQLPWRRRCVRWLRHKPPVIICGIVQLAWWIVRGRPPFEDFSRIQTADVIWCCSQARAEFRMGACVPMEMGGEDDPM